MKRIKSLFGIGIENDFANRHRVGSLIIPKSVERDYIIPCDNFVAPDKIDERPRMTKVEDQGSNPWCAAYAATQFAENVIWRKTGRPQNIDPSMIYIRAKEIDGMPGVNGTTLEAALQALIDTKVFDGKICKVRSIKRNQKSVQFALHRFGVILAGFNVTAEWWKLNMKKTAICSKYILPGQGGHAVCLCGYSDVGAYICNSWGSKWGQYGYGLITWDKLEEQMICGAVIDRCLDGMVA